MLPEVYSIRISPRNEYFDADADADVDADDVDDVADVTR